MLTLVLLEKLLYWWFHWWALWCKSLLNRKWNKYPHCQCSHRLPVWNQLLVKQSFTIQPSTLVQKEIIDNPNKNQSQVQTLQRHWLNSWMMLGFQTPLSVILLANKPVRIRIWWNLFVDYTNDWKKAVDQPKPLCRNWDQRNQNEMKGSYVWCQCSYTTVWLWPSVHCQNPISLSPGSEPEAQYWMHNGMNGGHISVAWLLEVLQSGVVLV